MKLGMIGLGRMGANMAERLRRGGHEVVGYDPHSDASQVASLAELAEALAGDGPRVAWSMVPSGDITQQTIATLSDLFSPGDLVVDGGNSNFMDSVHHGEMLAAKGIGFVDAGTSGGVWGLENGYALMVGGTADDVAKIAPALTTLAPPNDFAHVGPVGAGHYTKMIHNGIEYGMMQAYAEGYAILEANELDIDIEAAFKSWQQGSVVRSWLLDLLVLALDQDKGLADIKGVAADSGEGRWTATEAIRLGVSAPVITSSLFARYVSQREDQTSMKVVAALRNQFGGHSVEKEKA